MRAGLTLISMLLAAGTAAALDIVHFKDGRTIAGIVLSESEEEIVVRTLFKGSRGEIVGSADATFTTEEIKRIERMPPQERQVAIARSEALGDRTFRLFQALAEIRVLPALLQGRRAQRAESEHFEVISTCDEKFIKEVTFYLEEMLKAYKRHFRVRPDRPPRIKVYVLADKEEYQQYQKTRFGTVLENPAFYSTRGNFIVACNLVRKEKADEIRAKIEAVERDVRDHQDEMDQIDRKITEEVRKARKWIHAESTSAKRKIQRQNPPNLNSELRKIDQWRKLQLDGLKARERAAREKVDARNDQLKELIRTNRGVILHNLRVLAKDNERMFEMLFHEGFHAFAYNFLWEKGKRQVVPRWLDEGLACYYESSVVEAGYLIHGGVNKARLEHLRAARAEGKLVPIAKVVTGSPQDFLVAAGESAEHSGIYYNQSWAVTHYLVNRVPSSRIHAYVRAINAGVDRKQAFEALAGLPLARLEAEVHAHLVKMR